MPPGSYRLFARALDTNGQWSSALSTQLTVTAPAVSGTNVATAVAVAIGSTVQGNVVNSNGTNYFKVQVVAGEKYKFQTALGSLYDSVLTLLGTNGQTVIAQNDDMAPGNRASCITWQATSSGTYYLAVSSYPGSPVGSFSLITSSPAVSKSSIAPSEQPFAGQPGCSVAIPSATLQSAAAAAVLSSNSFGGATGAVSNASRGLDPAVLDTLFHALGR